MADNTGSGMADYWERLWRPVPLTESNLPLPLGWRKPARALVDLDLFAEEVPDAWIDRVFAVMALAPQHTFLVLTKRAHRMRQYLLGDAARRVSGIAGGTVLVRWPLPNAWLGVSVEDQARADERIPLLLQTPAAKRFISAEPLLSGTDIERYLRSMVVRPAEELTDRMVEAGWSHSGGQGDHPGLDWVIAGGESGPKARPCDLDWLRSIMGQCRSAGVACFVKQLGAKPTLHDFTGMPIKDKKGGDRSEWPEDLRVQEFPA